MTFRKILPFPFVLMVLFGYMPARLPLFRPGAANVSQPRISGSGQLLAAAAAGKPGSGNRLSEQASAAFGAMVVRSAGPAMIGLDLPSAEPQTRLFTAAGLAAGETMRLEKVALKAEAGPGPGAGAVPRWVMAESLEAPKRGAMLPAVARGVRGPEAGAATAPVPAAAGGPEAHLLRHGTPVRVAARTQPAVTTILMADQPIPPAGRGRVVAAGASGRRRPVLAAGQRAPSAGRRGNLSQGFRRPFSRPILAALQAAAWERSRQHPELLPRRKRRAAAEAGVELASMSLPEQASPMPATVRRFRALPAFGEDGILPAPGAEPPPADWRRAGKIATGNPGGQSGKVGRAALTAIRRPEVRSQAPGSQGASAGGMKPAVKPAAPVQPAAGMVALAAPAAGLAAGAADRLAGAGAMAGGNGMGVEVGEASSESLQVTVDRSLLIHTDSPLKRVAVSDPAVAQATVLSPNQVLVHGRAPGETSLMLWNQQEQASNYLLRVKLDAGAAEATLQHLFPKDQIRATASGRVLVLSGHVATPATAKQAVKIAGGFASDVVSTIQSGPEGPQEVLLEVKFAEVDRTALTQLAVNIFSTGAANTIGATSTGQFGGFSGSRAGSATGAQSSGSGGANTVTGSIGSKLAGQAASFGTSDLLNVFLFRSDINLGVLIKALEQKNLLQILAEPNLVAVSGKQASFLAGGEFPFPVVQSGGGYNAVTIQFKPFGVRLNFTPQIQPDGSIFLHVAPEVSALDFSNAVTLNGFVVPALSTRRADTSFELRDGQSFVIAGLMDNRLTNIASKIPGLGDLPILGQLFRSKNLQRSNTELMVLVTARLVSPEMNAPGLPKFPSPFLSPKQFDPVAPGAPGAPGAHSATGGKQ